MKLDQEELEVMSEALFDEIKRNPTIVIPKGVQGPKIVAMNYLRSQYNYSLKDAKALTDSVFILHAEELIGLGCPISAYELHYYKKKPQTLDL